MKSESFIKFRQAVGKLCRIPFRESAHSPTLTLLLIATICTIEIIPYSEFLFLRIPIQFRAILITAQLLALLVLRYDIVSGSKV